ncbi:LysR family transcriptional regulator [Limibacillus sp. MBR-115]|jgi:DNA-binding transcriptional LysR family regulator|uniref:LysR family transcriptional regulator n=1 Tax=Limibacillus sp. MBR-115 TaxID=3156465 RepID=UPI00339650C8
MDLSLIRTFIDVTTYGSFSEASERLHVSQSTVSSRIKTLEDSLGASLFQRGKRGAELTAAGRHFHRHALQLVETWEHARQDVVLPERYSERLRIGSEAGLWLRLLDSWVPWMRSKAPDVALRLDSGTPETLMSRMAEGLFDLVVMYTPDSRPGLNLIRLGEEDLVLVGDPGSLERSGSGQGRVSRNLPKGYIYVDWGRDFAVAHRAHFPEFADPGLVISIGLLAYRMVLETKGSGYLPFSLVGGDLKSGRLKRVETAPILKLPIYALARNSQDSPAATLAITGFRRILEEKFARDD